MYYTALFNDFTVTPKPVAAYNSHINLKERRSTMWTTPAATEIRLGMEITAYVFNR
jgi:coenzyme PQQ precursor peptide PqqA